MYLLYIYENFRNSLCWYWRRIFGQKIQDLMGLTIAMYSIQRWKKKSFAKMTLISFCTVLNILFDALLIRLLIRIYSYTVYMHMQCFPLILNQLILGVTSQTALFKYCFYIFIYIPSVSELTRQSERLRLLKTSLSNNFRSYSWLFLKHKTELELKLFATNAIAS